MHCIWPECTAPLLTRLLCAISEQFREINFLQQGERSYQNLRHAWVQSFRWVGWLTWGLDLKSFWLVQALKGICSLTWQHGFKFQLATKCCDSEKMSCHVILKSLYEPEMDVILTMNFKVTAEIEITKHVFCILLCRRGRVSTFCQA